MAKKVIKTASVLAFEKKLVVSDGYLFGTVWDVRHQNKTPLQINEKSVRGTISNRLGKDLNEDPAKLDAAVESPNLQIVDSCSLGVEQDTLCMQFTLKILGNVGIPSACNDTEFQRNLLDAAKSYGEEYGFKELGLRYAISLASGRFFWRNRVGSDALEIIVRDSSTNTHWIFDGYAYPIRDFDCNDQRVQDLGDRIASVLSSSEGYLLLEIESYAKLGKSQEVYPSEELILGRSKNQQEKSKVLYQVNGQAAMHSQKIGNALRTIDTWYPEVSENDIGPIAVEPYGAVTTMGKAFRNPTTKKDFYTLFEKFALGEKLHSPEDEHYVMAILVRGGVFGESSKE
jgi:CRISPR-associated protein Csy3